MISILRPRIPPISLICFIANFSASCAPVSLIAMVPVSECKIPTVTVSSVTARPVLFTSSVGRASALAVSMRLTDVDAINVFNLVRVHRNGLFLNIICSSRPVNSICIKTYQHNKYSLINTVRLS